MTINEAWWKPEPAWPIPENKGKDVVLTGAKLIDGNGGPVIDDPVIVIKGERIVDEVPTYRGEGKAFL